MNTEACPTCGRPWDTDVYVPAEPPVGTWVRDRHGAVTYHQTPGGWGQPGMMPAAKWDAMWKARGPLVECAPWGRVEDA